MTDCPKYIYYRCPACPPCKKKKVEPVPPVLSYSTEPEPEKWIGELSEPKQACVNGNPVYVNVEFPFKSTDFRLTDAIEFPLEMFKGDILPVTEFALDDLAFIVGSDFVGSDFEVNAKGRVFPLPDNSLIIVDGNNPQFAVGKIDHKTTTTFRYRNKELIIPPLPHLFTSDVVKKFGALGMSYQPHNAISLKRLEELGYVKDNSVKFKILHITHGLGNLTLKMSIPTCS